MNRKCRIKNDKLIPFLNLGKQPLANGFLGRKDKIKKEYFFNLKVGFSQKSKMVQLLQVPKKEKIFNKNYAFYSSTSKYMDIHFTKFSKKIKNFIKSKKIQKPLIVEIGSNDGIMLRHFKNMDHIGIEPSKNVADVCKKKQKCNVINDFFNQKTIKKIDKYFKKKVDVFYAANVMCHIENIKPVFSRISKCLSNDGIFVFEDPYMGDVIKKNSYDQIYDEHVYLFSLASIKILAEINKMELFDAEPQITHGGSMRYFLCKKNTYPKSNRLKRLVYMEKRLKLDKISTYVSFANRIYKSKNDLIKLLQKLKKKGKKICAYGATSKSTTIFNFCKINSKLISNYYDNTKIKQNKYSPGMHILVKSFSKMKKYPDYFFLSAWNHKNEIFSKEKKFKKIGGKWIVHVPEVKII